MARRSTKRQDKDNGSDTGPQVAVAPKGGRLRPLTRGQVERITQSAFDILEGIGLSGLPDAMAQRVLDAGATRRTDGRICFPTEMVHAAIGRAPDTITLPGLTPDFDLTIGDGHVHLGTGGAAVQILNAATGTYEDASLEGLYRLMRVLEASENIHYGLRPVVARDMEDAFALDINTAFACVKATRKPIGISFANAAHVAPVVELFDMVLGGAGRFAQRPFCMGVVVHVVPPLRFATEGIDSLEAVMRAGMIPQICSAGQAGATSPVSLAGALAQGLAECLAGLMVVDVIRPGAPCIYAFMPFISDLRTGAMTGGSGESAIANAAAAQLLLHLGLPSTVSAGMTDAKVQDAQAGYEKGYTISLAAHAGADMINLSMGMLGSIMVASPEAMVIDNEMCGAILRSVRGVDVSDSALDLDVIDRVVTQEGHYLGEAETLKRMKTEYLYPDLANRQSVQDWIDAGGQTIWESARARVEDILSAPPATHVSPEAEAAIRARFPIHLKD